MIEIQARRYAFDPPTIDIAAGEPVRLVVRSADGLHGLAIERLAIRREIPRGGDAIVVDFVAKDAGRYPIVCSEYCGSGHEQMRGTLVVHARGDGATETVDPPDGVEDRR